MGDMCDLPNFEKRSWFRRGRWMRALVAAAAAMLAAIAWGETPSFPENVEMTLQFLTPSPRVLIGQPLNYSIHVKNNGDQTVKLSDMQVGVYLTAGSCVEKDAPPKRIFSLPYNIAVAPNTVETVSGHIEVITPCDGKASSEIFTVIQRNTQRLTIKRPGPSFEVL